MKSPLATSLVIAVVVGLALAALSGNANGEPQNYTSDDTLAAIHQASEQTGISEAWLYRTVNCESTLDPYAVGKLGELGAAQLASFGELPTFYAWGNDDPNNPYQAVLFMAQRFGQGGSRAWSCA